MSVNNKAALIVLGILIGSVISASSFLAFNFLTSARVEGLTVENFTVQNMTDVYSPIEFDLQNTGNTNIEIVSVAMNSYLNQSVQNWNRGWIGNLALKPGQSGKVYVYEFCYFYVLNASMPQVSASPSQLQLANLNSWANLYTCMFSFITQTRNEYNQVVPRLAADMIQAWLGAPTKFTNAISFNIVACNFYGTSGSATNYINMTIQNTGGSQFVISTAAIVTGIGVINTTKTLAAQVPVAAGTSVAVKIWYVGWTDGDQYSIQLLTTNGQKITYVTTASSTALQESMYMSNLHVWYNTTGIWAEAAFSLTNTGATNIAIQSITARSESVIESNIYYWATSTATITSLAITATPLPSSTDTALINGTPVTLKQGLPILNSGWTFVVYVMQPDSVGQNDVGTPCDVTVFTTNAQWTQECNVEAAPPADQFNIASVVFSGTSGASTNYINMTIQNTGSSSWTLQNTAQVNSVAGLTVTSIGNNGAYNCTGGKFIRVVIAMTPGWVSGNQYSITMHMTDGTKVSYVADTAPADEFNIATVNFVGTSGSTTAGSNQINMTIQNTGSSSWTLQPTAQVNSVSGLPVKSYSNGGGGLNCTSGHTINIYVDTHTSPWISGNQYSITIYMTDGTKITYIATAP